MRLHWKLLRLAVPVVLLFTAGCGGINASKSVSPLDFFLPGLIKADPQSVPAETEPAPTLQVALAQ